jgi:hypothetical protein
MPPSLMPMPSVPLVSRSGCHATGSPLDRVLGSSTTGTQLSRKAENDEYRRTEDGKGREDRKARYRFSPFIGKGFKCSRDHTTI